MGNWTFLSGKKPFKALHVGKHQILSTLCIYWVLDLYLYSSDEGGYHYSGGNLEHIELTGGGFHGKCQQEPFYMLENINFVKHSIHMLFLVFYDRQFVVGGVRCDTYPS